MSYKDESIFMDRALEAARDAFSRDEVPVGAVVVDKESREIIAVGSNRTRELRDPTGHAEILALRDACSSLGVQRLVQADIYVSLEPCPMCAAAISYARIHTLYFAAQDTKSGGVVNGPCLYTHSALHHKPLVQQLEGGHARESSVLLKTFFQSKRHPKPGEFNTGTVPKSSVKVRSKEEGEK